MKGTGLTGDPRENPPDRWHRPVARFTLAKIRERSRRESNPIHLLWDCDMQGCNHLNSDTARVRCLVRAQTALPGRLRRANMVSATERIRAVKDPGLGIITSGKQPLVPAHISSTRVSTSVLLPLPFAAANTDFCSTDRHVQDSRYSQIRVSEEIWTALNIDDLRADEDPRENPPTNGIDRHDSHMRKSEVTRPGIEPGSPWWEASLRSEDRFHCLFNNARMKGRGKREIPEKTRRPTSSPGMITAIEPGSPWWEASGLTAQPLWPLHNMLVNKKKIFSLLGQNNEVTMVFVVTKFDQLNNVRKCFVSSLQPVIHNVPCTARGLDHGTVECHRSVRLHDTRHLTLRHYTMGSRNCTGSSYTRVKAYRRH
ncbi:hypothetical protein PR048_000438 [Dryococelus australis]|uniref:Uncharacterized protein n=1 Tax=Dryococelus australis TaxID=614101 RepID=A0ABQ9IEL4_9NEOP|nr:hypothetical protein PR048_000438 [Dryococelus australis]